MLTLVIMKCFERLVMAKIKVACQAHWTHSNLPITNRSTDYAISIATHTAAAHLDKRNTYVRMLLIDYSSAFDTTVPSKLDNKFRAWVCNWILEFLKGSPQAVRIGNNTSPNTTAAPLRGGTGMAPSITARPSIGW